MRDIPPSHMLTSHLGIDSHRAGLIMAKSFRSVVTTVHRVRDFRWRWAPQDGQDRYAAVFFPRFDVEQLEDEPIGLFLPADAAETIDWERPTDVVGVWMRAESLDDFMNGAQLERMSLQPSPLTTAFRAFARSVAHEPDTGSSISRYAIERLLAEMVFSAVLETQAGELPERGPASLLDRARSTMLLHREDPAFTVTELASELHVSPRHLQRAFARAQTTPGDALRLMRVELAESLLRNPDYAPLSVDEIARHSGFSNGLQLRRALRAEGLPAPSELRPALVAG
ncbi:helix-turn-helix domain-containing protein [Microbacterium sp.]|uniref:helix-turn-helix domain-containing protein n=1 Tax=Microbacterium sp. TaxID=51671 RepID=UPI00334004B4